jgi:hypothetical protein
MLSRKRLVALFVFVFVLTGGIDDWMFLKHTQVALR